MSQSQSQSQSQSHSQLESQYRLQSLPQYEYTLYDVYIVVRDEIYNISYMEKEEQIDALIYCINYICDYNVDLDAPINSKFLKSIKKECEIAFHNLDYPPIEEYESEMCYIIEMLQTQTMLMIEVAIEEFNKYII
jgi:hypothetical protein